MTTLSASPLNLNQSPEELKKLYDEDYYWYLRSQEFQETFLRRIGICASMLGDTPKKVLDVGCGEGQLSRFVDCGYVGFDGSQSAVERARNNCPNLEIYHARFEDPPLLGSCFSSAIFGGIMEVLIKPESRVDFLSMYADRYGLEYAIIYDLERLDHSEITLSGRFDLIGEWHGSVPPMNGVEDVKRHRKILLYEVLPE